MELQPSPAGLAQLTRARDGRWVEVADDVAGIAAALARVDPCIRLRFSEAGEHFVVYYRPENGEDEYLIFTATELDHRIVKHMEEVYARCNAPGWSFADELERTEAVAEREKERAWRNEHGEKMERLAYAMLKDTHRDQNRIFVPKGLTT